MTDHLKIDYARSIRLVNRHWFSIKQRLLRAFYFGVAGMTAHRIFRSVGAQMRFIADQCYERIPIDYCIYCVDAWEVLDHVPPIAAYCTNSSWAFKYPACKNCNSILSALPIKDIRVRRWFILKKILTRYGKILRMPNWKESEISTLQGWIIGYIRSCGMKQKHLINRIDFLASNYLEPAELRETHTK